jgi:predicted nucleic acid-binding protein
VLRRKLRKGEVSTAQADRAIETLPDLFSQIVRSTDLIRDAWRIAEALDHSVYDCLYLACAEQRGVKLVTADDRFRDKARSRGRSSRVIPLSAAAGL